MEQDVLGAPNPGAFVALAGAGARHSPMGRRVLDALAHLNDVTYLESHPLAQPVLDAGDGQNLSKGKALQSRLLVAIDALRPGPGGPAAAVRPALERFQLVNLRYVQMETVPVICSRLRISQSEYYREHRLGVEAIISLLFDQPAGTGVLPAPGTPSTRGFPPAPRWAPQRDFPHVTPFVGRTNQLSLLKALVENVFTDRKGTLVLISGEAGIGKTRLVHELALYTRFRGGLFLEGRYGRGGEIAYAPWVEVLRSGLRSLPPELVAECVNPYSDAIAPLLPELANNPLGLAPPFGSIEEQQSRLYDSIGEILRNLSRRAAPLVVFVDNLQWAPRLAVLTRVAHRLADVPLLLVGAFREQEVREQPGLDWDVANLTRDPAVVHVVLSPLTEGETERMVSSMFGDGLASELRSAIYGTARGNPTFIEETLRSLIERNVVRPSPFGWQASAAERVMVTDSTTLAVEERVVRLGEQGRTLLEQAAVLGQEFTVAVLGRMSGLDGLSLWRQIERATAAGLLVERSSQGEARYGFADHRIQEAVSSSLPRGRSREYHIRAACAMEAEYGEADDEHAGELAEHLTHSSEVAELLKAVGYLERAGRRAAEVHAYTTAARFFERALGIERGIPIDRARRCDLLLALGEVLGPAGDPLRVADEIAGAALRLAESMRDEDRARRACHIGFDAMSRYGAGAAPRTERYRRWTNRAARHAPQGTVDKIYLDVATAWIAWVNGEFAPAVRGFRQAFEQARTFGDPQALFHVAGVVLTVSPAPQVLSWQQDVAEELSAHPMGGVSARSAGAVLWRSANVFLQWGDRTRAEGLWRQVDGLAQRTQDSYLLLYPMADKCVLSLLNGELEIAVESGKQIVAHANAWGMPAVGSQIAATLTYAPYLHLGAAEEALALLRRPVQPVHATAKDDLLWAAGYRALCLAHLGQTRDAQVALNRLLRQPRVGFEDALTPAYLLTLMLDTAIRIGDRETAALLAPRLEAASLLCLSGAGYTCVARILGAAMALLGAPESARTWYVEALRISAAVGSRPEAALVRLQLAELLLEHYPDQREEAIDHLGKAIGGFEAMNMRPSLRQALKHRARLDSPLRPLT